MPNKTKDQNPKIKNKKPKTTAVKKVAVKEEKPARARISKDSGLMLDVFDVKGRVIEKIELPKEVFGAKINEPLMAQAVRVYLANQRAGTASTKTRGEVKGSSRKIYRQKGTGRARHGSVRAPIFVHGGIVFGPKPRDYSLKLTKKMKKQALFSALSAKKESGEIKILGKGDKIGSKTKEMAQALKNLQLKDGILFVLPNNKFENLIRAARNLKGLELIFAYQLNTYEVLKNKILLMLSESIPTIKDHFVKGEEK